MLLHKPRAVKTMDDGGSQSARRSKYVCICIYIIIPIQSNYAHIQDIHDADIHTHIKIQNQKMNRPVGQVPNPINGAENTVAMTKRRP